MTLRKNILLTTVLVIVIGAGFYFFFHMMDRGAEATAKAFLTEVFSYSPETLSLPEPEHSHDIISGLEAYYKTRFSHFLTENGLDKFAQNGYGVLIAVENQKNGTFYEVNDMTIEKNKAADAAQFHFTVNISAHQTDSTILPMIAKGTVTLLKENQTWKINALRVDSFK